MRKDTTKAKRLYRILTPSDREEIMIGLRKNESIRTIAKTINRNPSVVSREIKNNITEDDIYQCYWAQKRSERRRKVSRLRERISDYEIRSYLEEKLKQEWSPEQIAGRIKLDLGKSVSYETIYQYIFKKDRSLVKYLLCGRKHRRKRKLKRKRRVMIPDRTGIEERPKTANTREEVGHWEADTAVSRQSKTSIMVLQERKLGITIIEKMPRCAPGEMNEAIIKRLSRFPQKMRQTITYDNGQENRYHMDLHEALGVKTYFCNPYSSWEKGSVENAIGLTRRVWPKKTDYELISDEEITNMEYKLNTRPRKRFKFLSPLEYAVIVALSP